MPRNSKEKESIVVSEGTKKIKKTEKKPATSNIKKQTVKKEVASKKNSNENSKKTSTSTKSTATKKTNKSTTAKKVVAKKETTKKRTTKSTATKKSKTSPSTKKQIEVLEYYDLPYRYNQTTVKLLAHTKFIICLLGHLRRW